MSFAGRSGSRRSVRRVARVESIEDFATLTAHLASPFADRAGLLAGAALDESSWEELRAGYAERLAKAAQSPSKIELCHRYRDAFEAARAERPEPIATPAPRTASAPPEVAAPPPPIPQAPAFTPSYLREPAQPPPAPSHMLGGPLRSATPAPASYVAPSQPAPSAPQAPPAMVAPPPMVAAPALIQIGAPAPGASAKPPLGGTAFLDGPLPGVREAMSLPFKQGAPPSTPAPSSAPKSSISTGTRMAPEGMPIKSLPFAGSERAEGNLTGWTVERYAELCVDLYASGRPRAEVLYAYGLDEARYKALDGYWEGAMAKDPELTERWASATARRKQAFARR